jgi:formylglycine-generating enzyme
MKRLFILLVLTAVMITACGGESFSGTPQTFDTGVDPEAWVTIPAGEFIMGQHEDETMVDYDYEIMVTDVTNAQYAAYLNEAWEAGSISLVEEDQEIVGYYHGDEFNAFHHEEEIAEGDWLHIPIGEEGLRIDFDGTTFTVQPGYENHPMVMVTWFGAQAYCEFYEGQLPTEVEWEKAARGTEDTRAFPWGNEIERNNANYYSSRDLFEKIIGGKGGDTTPVGFYNGQTYDYDGEEYETLASVSPYGLYDMAGNVWQWMGDIYEDQHYRYMRGGSRANYEYNLRVWASNNAAPQHYSPSIGFRCVRDS